MKHEDRDDRAWDYKTTFGIGSTVDVSVKTGEVEVEVGADAYVDVGMSRGQAYDAWRAMHPSEVLRNSMQDKERPYYYGFGASVEPRVDVSFRGVKMGGSVSGAVFSSLEGQDRDQEMLTVDPSFTDTDARANAYVGVERGDFSVKLDGQAFRRGGSANEASDSTTGKSAMVTVAFRR
jgi:hypothetical protein